MISYRAAATAVLAALTLLASGCSDAPETPQDQYTDACIASFKELTQWGGLARGAICACRAKESSEFLTGEQMRAYAENPFEFMIPLVGTELADDIIEVENSCTLKFCDRYGSIEAEMCAFFKANLDR